MAVSSTCVVTEVTLQKDLMSQQCLVVCSTLIYPKINAITQLCSVTFQYEVKEGPLSPTNLLAFLGILLWAKHGTC